MSGAAVLILGATSLGFAERAHRCINPHVVGAGRSQIKAIEMTGSSVAPVTIVCHVSVDIACSPERLWKRIESGYTQGKKFSESGYTLQQLDDPAAFLGSYLMKLEQDGVVIDERVVRVNELDEAARRVSLHGEYLSASSNGLDVFATYQSVPIPTGARFVVDCHGHYRKWPLPGGDRAEVRAAIDDLKVASEAGLVQFLASVKAELERAP